MQIPLIGLGTYQVPQEATAAVVLAALNAGYKYIDCAYLYGNEQQIGEAFGEYFKTHDRQSVFISTKLWNTNHHKQRVRKQLEYQLKQLQITYVDQFIVHWPIPYDHANLKEVWQAMEQLVEQGLTKTISVSNYSIMLLKELYHYAKIKPVTNQIEVHPFFQNEELIRYCHSIGLHVTAYSPLCGTYDHIKGMRVLQADPAIQAMCERYRKDTGQIILRWHIQKFPAMYSVIPKTQTIARLATNLEITDFALEPREMDYINSLDEGVRGCDPVKIWNVQCFE